MTKQNDLPEMNGPGIAPVRIEELDTLAAAYVKERDKRCRQTPKEVEAKQKLVEALHRHESTLGRDAEGVLRYEYEDVVIELRPGEEKLKVRKAVDELEQE